MATFIVGMIVLSVILALIGGALVIYGYAGDIRSLAMVGMFVALGAAWLFVVTTIVGVVAGIPA